MILATSTRIRLMLPLNVLTHFCILEGLIKMCRSSLPEFALQKKSFQTISLEKQGNVSKTKLSSLRSYYLKAFSCCNSNRLFVDISKNNWQEWVKFFSCQKQKEFYRKNTLDLSISWFFCFINFANLRFKDCVYNLWFEGLLQIAREESKCAKAFGSFLGL